MTELIKNNKIFISYKRDVDDEFAHWLAKTLQEEGFNVWIDIEAIPTGSNWDREIEKNLNIADFFIIILSPESVESDNVRNELDRAIERKMKIIPIVVRKCEVPLSMQRIQRIEFFKDNVAAIDKIMLALGIKIVLHESEKKVTKEKTDKQNKLNLKELNRESNYQNKYKTALNYIDDKRYSSALRLLKECLELFPDRQEAIERVNLCSNKIKEQEINLVKTKEIEERIFEDKKKESEYQDIYITALNHFNSKRYPTALRGFKQALKLFPRRKEVLEKVNLCENKIKEAEVLMKRNVEEQQEKKGTEYDKIFNTGQSHFDAKNYEAALSSFEKALNLFPEKEDVKQIISLCKTKIEENNKLTWKDVLLLPLALVIEYFKEIIGVIVLCAVGYWAYDYWQKEKNSSLIKFNEGIPNHNHLDTKKIPTKGRINLGQNNSTALQTYTLNNEGLKNSKIKKLLLENTRTITRNEVITPDGNGINDIFKKKLSSGFSFISLKVYDSFGQVIYSYTTPVVSKDKNENIEVRWNCTRQNGQKVSLGIYNYEIKSKNNWNNLIEIIKGKLTISS